MTERRIAPVHLGEVLLEDFLKPMEISQYRLAKSVGAPVQRIHNLVHGRETTEPGAADDEQAPLRSPDRVRAQAERSTRIL